jgi:hypothetical protein
MLHSEAGAYQQSLFECRCRHRGWPDLTHRVQPLSPLPGREVVVRPLQWNIAPLNVTKLPSSYSTPSCHTPQYFSAGSLIALRRASTECCVVPSRTNSDS